MLSLLKFLGATFLAALGLMLIFIVIYALVVMAIEMVNQLTERTRK